MAVNFAITFGFFGFWHCALYLVGLSERPFNPTRNYRFSKVLHNMWYCFLGVVQMTIWEAIFMHCYATKRLPFMNDKEAFSNSWNITMFVLAAFWVPLYRELHFYFAHVGSRHHHAISRSMLKCHWVNKKVISPGTSWSQPLLCVLFFMVFAHSHV